MKRTGLAIVLLALSGASEAFAGALLYDNTTTDTFNSVLFSIGPYSGVGDQVHLDSTAAAIKARLQFFNAGAAGMFDVDLRFYEVGAPVGIQVGKSFTWTGASAGFDVVDVEFDLGGLALPQDLVFVARVTAEPGMDLGVNLFEPPTVGFSDNTFLVVDDGVVAQQMLSANENVYFQLTAVPEPSTFVLSGIAGAGLMLFRMRSAKRSTKPNRGSYR